ncbi:hypothetical protein DFH27DRAFT_106725 [Peziza echinospora]|nr:hypothetical protein DFH27DRAFT_106725 [Peziza echinospora]
MPLQWPAAVQDLQLDLVGLLAVIGEAAMSSHAQIATATRWTLIPRLIPAPQALLRHSRPYRLPALPNTKVIGVHSGNFMGELNYFPSILHNIEVLPSYSFLTLTITHKMRNQEHIELGAIPLRRTGPIIILTVLGFFAAIAILGIAIWKKDGMAVVAIILLAATSTFVGLSSHWGPELTRRKRSRDVPAADVILVGRQGAFVHIKCNENVARELYFGHEECIYRLSETWFQFLAGCGTFMLMAAVIAMANCTWDLQASMGVTYITLNGLYWLAALLPGEFHWKIRDIYDVHPRHYKVPQVGKEGATHLENARPGVFSGLKGMIKDTVEDAIEGFVHTNTEKGGEENAHCVVYKTYSAVLIAAIKQTGTTAWVARGEVAPVSQAWNDWLQASERLLEQENGRELYMAWGPQMQLISLYTH